jgi:hypothetical protein
MPLGIEDKIHKNFATFLTYNKRNLDCVWWSYDASGEKRNKLTASLLKSKGLKAGRSDYSFYYKRGSMCYILFIEFKKPAMIKPDGTRTVKGKQSQNQIDFQNSFNNLSNVNYELCYSITEAEQILRKHSILK